MIERQSQGKKEVYLGLSCVECQEDNLYNYHTEIDINQTSNMMQLKIFYEFSNIN